MKRTEAEVETEIKRCTKDNVFTHLFSEPEY